MGGNTILVVILAAAVIVLMFLRTRRARPSVPMPRRFEDMRAEEAAAPKGSEWHLKDLGPGGMIHLSLPKGLEEDFVVVRRDRVTHPDERIEYDLRLQGEDAAHPAWLNWWTIGVRTHAWLVEGSEYTLARLGLTEEALDEARRSSVGSITFLQEPYTLVEAATLAVLEGGQRPSRDVPRWEYRNARGTRQVLVQRKEWESSGEYQVLIGQELWLRDLTIIAPRGETPGSPQAAPPTGPQPEQPTV